MDIILSKEKYCIKNLILNEENQTLSTKLYGGSHAMKYNLIERDWRVASDVFSKLAGKHTTVRTIHLLWNVLHNPGNSK